MVRDDREQVKMGELWRVTTQKVAGRERVSSIPTTPWTSTAIHRIQLVKDGPPIHMNIVACAFLNRHLKDRA
jgi:hypothetical protein